MIYSEFLSSYPSALDIFLQQSKSAVILCRITDGTESEAKNIILSLNQAMQLELFNSIFILSYCFINHPLYCIAISAFHLEQSEEMFFDFPFHISVLIQILYPVVTDPAKNQR